MNVVEAGKRIMLRNILFTTDFSPCSDTALPYAVSLARKYGATLHAAHAMPTMADIVFMSPEGWSTLAMRSNCRLSDRSLNSKAI